MYHYGFKDEYRKNIHKIDEIIADLDKTNCNFVIKIDDVSFINPEYVTQQ